MNCDAPDRRSVIAGGIALAGTALLPSAGAAQAGLGPAADLLAATRKFLAGLDGNQRKAASFAWDGPQWRRWDYFGSGDNIKPGLRLEVDERGAEGGRLGRARDAAVAGRHREDPQRDDAAGRAGVAGQHAGPAFVGAVLVRGVRHAGGNRRLGVPARRPPPASVDLGARQPHRVGHAVVVLGQSQPRHLRQACRTGHAAR